MEDNEKYVIKFSLSFKLWWINSWLRFTGFRVFVGWHNDDEGNLEWTKIGLAWYGRPSQSMNEATK